MILPRFPLRFQWQNEPFRQEWGPRITRLQNLSLGLFKANVVPTPDCCQKTFRELSFDLSRATETYLDLLWPLYHKTPPDAPWGLNALLTPIAVFYLPWVPCRATCAARVALQKDVQTRWWDIEARPDERDWLQTVLDCSTGYDSLAGQAKVTTRWFRFTFRSDMYNGRRRFRRGPFDPSTNVKRITETKAFTKRLGL